MTQSDMIRLAREAGIPETATEGVFIANSDDLGRLIAAEREACAKLCFQMWNEWMDNESISELNRPDAEDCAHAIRKRGQI